MQELKRRPKKTEAEKLSESVYVRMSNADYEAFYKIAISRRLPVALLAVTLLAEKKCFVNKVSDDEYEELLSRPEMMQNVQQNFRKEERHIIACRMTKEDKKSLTYQAVIKKHCAPTILVNSIITEVIKNATKQK